MKYHPDLMNYRFILPMLLALGACAGKPHLESTPAVQVVDFTSLPSPSGIASGIEIYRIGAQDSIVVDVYGFPDITNRELVVDAAGRISIPIAGAIAVGGLTPSEAEFAITARLQAAHVRQPRVAVNLKEAFSRFVTVEGQVGQPGNYPVLSDMTLMRAVASARGTGEFARTDDVVVFRTVKGQRLAALYDLGAIRRGQYGDPQIYAKDIIVVGNSPARRLFRDVISLAPLFSAPIIALSR